MHQSPWQRNRLTAWVSQQLSPSCCQASADDPVVVLGATRARLLRTVAEAAGTTTDVARRLGLPPSTASRQLAALREAGLVVSHRHGNRVPHAATEVGIALLEA